MLARPCMPLVQRSENTNQKASLLEVIKSSNELQLRLSVIFAVHKIPSNS